MGKKKILLFTILITIIFNGILYSENIDDNSVSENTISLKQNLNNFLNKSGLEFQVSYKGEIWNIPKSGIRNSIAYVDNIDLIFGTDLDKIFSWTGASLSVYFLGNNGSEPNEFIESSHGISNIAAPKTWKLYTMSFEQKLFDEKLSFLIGLYDYNSEFDVKESAFLFINPSQGIGLDIAQSGDNGPSIFPTASFGARIRANPVDDMYILATVLDGVPGNPNNTSGTNIMLNPEDGLFVGTEVGFDNSLIDGKGNYKIGGGVWYYTDHYNHLMSNVNNWGIYGLFDKSIFKEEDGTQGLTGFGRIGVANIKKNNIGFFFAGGLVYKGLIPGRDNDEAGIAFASGFRIENNHNYQEEGCFENNIEITYKLEISNGLFIQPDFQYIMCPKDKNVENDYMVFGARLILELF